MQWGDVPSWVQGVGTVVGAVVAVVAAVFARGSGKAAKAQADRAERAAGAAERSALAQERIAKAMEGARLPWLIDRVGGDSFRLRNETDEVALNVTVLDEDDLLPIHRDLPKGYAIDAHKSMRFIMMGVQGRPIPGELLIASSLSPDGPVAVPMPNRPPKSP